MTKTRTKLHHIVIALDADSQSLAAIERAVELAQQLQAELTGTFIEDLDLIHSAQLPFTVEIVAHNAQERKVSVSHMERSLKARAEQARQLLEKLASRAQIRWQFNTLRTRRRNCNLPQLLRSNLLLIPQPDIFNLQPPQSTRFQQAKNIFVVFDQSDQGKYCLKLAEQIAEISKQSIVLLHDPETSMAGISSKHLTAEFAISPDNPDTSALRSYCNSHSPSLVLIPDNHHWQQSPQLMRSLQNLMRCPFILVNQNY